MPVTSTLLAPTPPNPTGPAYRAGAPVRRRLAPEGVRGEALVVEGRVLHRDERPVAGAVLDLWHASPRGVYDVLSRDMRFRGRVRVEDDGAWRVETVVPGGYLWRPPHVHVKVWVDDAVALTTQIYIAGHRRLRIDPHVRDELIAPIEAHRLRFDLVLGR